MTTDIAAVSKGGGVWTPERLFSNGETGGWYDISDLTTLFSDVAGASQAVVDGPVGKILDKSGNDFHLSSDGAHFATLRNSGELYYLEFSTAGTHYFVTNAAIGDIAEFAAAVSKDDAASYANLVRFGADGGQNLFMSLDADGQWRDSSDMFNSSATVWVNGVQTLSFTDGASTPNVVRATKANANSSAQYLVLSTTNGADATWLGRVYGFVAIDRLLSAMERTKLEEVLAAKAGITFP